MLLDFQPVWVQEGGRLWSPLQLCSWLSGSNRSPVLEPGSGYSPDHRRPERRPPFCTCFPSSCDIGEKDHQEDWTCHTNPGHVDKSTFFNETILSRHMLAPFHFLFETDISWNVQLHKIKKYSIFIDNPLNGFSFFFFFLKKSSRHLGLFFRSSVYKGNLKTICQSLGNTCSHIEQWQYHELSEIYQMDQIDGKPQGDLLVL